jgi:hypothetical protein
MNGFHFAQMVSRLVRVSRPRRVAVSIGLIVLGLAMTWLAEIITTSRRGGSGGQIGPLQATLADAPSWGRVRPRWPKYLPESPTASGTAAAQIQPAMTVTPAVIHVPKEAAAELPSIETGPELFAPTIQPVPMAAAQTQPAAPKSLTKLTTPPALTSPDVAPQVSAPRPAGPAPIPVVASIPARMPAAPSIIRSEAMEKIARQSDQRIRDGFELANRGAYFAARADFIAALRLIAQGLDNEGNSTSHSQALSAALIAMKEAQDFIPVGGKLEGDLDVPPLVAGHRTPVLKVKPPQQVPVMRALKQYFTYAQEQLALAAGQEVSGSVALGALGKIHAALAGKPNPEVVAPEAKAIVFFQAAILVCPRNFTAANDLGVLLAHNGDSTGARRLLEHSVLVHRCSDNLSNLSTVYRQIGELRLAELAAEKARAAKAAEVAWQKSASLSAGGAVEWVDPTALAQSPGPWSDPSSKPMPPAGQQEAAKPIVGLLPMPFAPATAR